MASGGNDVVSYYLLFMPTKHLQLCRWHQTCKKALIYQIPGGFTFFRGDFSPKYGLDKTLVVGSCEVQLIVANLRGAVFYFLAPVCVH